MKPNFEQTLILFNIDIYEYLLMQGICHYACAEHELIHRVFREPWTGYFKNYLESTSEENLKSCLSRLVDKGLVEITCKDTIVSIIDHLGKTNGSVVFEGLPTPGIVDLTETGGQIWEGIQRARNNIEKNYSSTDYMDNHIKHVYCSNSLKNTKLELKNFMTEFASADRLVFLLDGPRLIRNWRIRWWNSPVRSGYTFCAHCKYEQVS